MSDAYRQSALLLHGIGDVDRQWLLAQLTDEQRTRLSEQLAELSQLGMPPDRSLVEEILAHAGGKAALRGEGPGQALRAARPELALHLLNQEPAWLVAAVLSMDAWPWREAIYVGLDAGKRDRVKRALREALPPKLERALLTRLEARLPDAAKQLKSGPVEQQGLIKLVDHIKRRSRTWI